MTYELRVYWSEMFDAETGLPVTRLWSCAQRCFPLAVFRGTMAECQMKAVEVVAATPPRQQRYVPTMGLLPQLCVTIGSSRLDRSD